MKELYAVRNWFEGRDLLITEDLDKAVAEFNRRYNAYEKVGLGRVRDGASWKYTKAGGFGQRLYTEAGDALRLAEARKAVLS